METHTSTKTLNKLGLSIYHPTINLSGLTLQIPYKDARRIVTNLGVTPDLADKHVWQFANKGDYVLESIALEHGITKAKNLTRRELVNTLILIAAQRIVGGMSMETLVIYGIEQIDLLTMRLRVKRGAMTHDECMRTLKASYKLSKAYHATI